jgi:hypothetical protein
LPKPDLLADLEERDFAGGAEATECAIRNLEPGTNFFWFEKCFHKKSLFKMFSGSLAQQSVWGFVSSGFENYGHIVTHRDAEILLV